jgi:predicted nucleic acid-binding protein
VVVADACSIVDFVIRRRARGDWVADRLAEAGIAHSPHLVDVEVVSALRRLVHRGSLEVHAAGRALELFRDLRVQRYPMTLFLSRIWALRETLSAYDAAYIVLAEALDLPLITTDARLARSHGHQAHIIAFTP